MGQKLITFKYNGEIYKSQNLKKKLKKLGIAETDIEILPDEIKETQMLTNPDYAYYFNVKTLQTLLIHINDFNSRNKHDDLKSLIWDEKTKTGIRTFAINDWVLLNGKPKYPIILDSNNLPELEKTYNWVN